MRPGQVTFRRVPDLVHDLSRDRPESESPILRPGDELELIRTPFPPDKLFNDVRMPVEGFYEGWFLSPSEHL